MNPSEGFDRRVAAWLHADAEHRVPEHLDAVLRRTSTERQRPAWSSLERWFPVQTTLRLAPVPKVAWLLLILAIVISLGVALVAAGLRYRPSAPPFGPARNGVIVFGGTDGDIHTLDPTSGATTALVSGSSNDRDPLVSPDGTRMLFLRDTTVPDPILGGFEPTLMVANVDGSGVRALTEALVDFDATVWVRRAAWSSDGSRLAVASNVDGKPRLRVFAVDGSAKPVIVDVQGVDATFLSFRPGDREVTFLGNKNTGVALYAASTDGRTLRTIVEPGDADYASLSPDGTKLAYAARGGSLGAYSVLHVVDVDTGLDRVPALDPPVRSALADNEPSWSPDGTLLLFQRYGVDTYRMAVAPAVGGAVVEFGPELPWHTGTYVGAQFSPDGMQILAHYDDVGSTWMLDPGGSTPGRLLPSNIATMASWQRLAP